MMCLVRKGIKNYVENRFPFLPTGSVRFLKIKQKLPFAAFGGGGP